MADCPLCKLHPGSHSFSRFGDLNGAALFYTAPSESTDFRESDERLADFRMHLAEASGIAWIWVFDCGNMEAKHSTPVAFAVGLARVLIAEHEDTLQEIWILRSNMWLYSIIKVFQKLFTSKLLNRIRFMEDSVAELYTDLKEKGLGLRPLRWLLDKLRL